MAVLAPVNDPQEVLEIMVEHGGIKNVKKDLRIMILLFNMKIST